MNVNTGEIKEFRPEEFKNLLDEWIEINKDDITENQKKNKKVSLKDHSSKLGKILTKERKRRSQVIHASDTCPCGSGKKHKFCCRNKKSLR